jgi:hypothetical protein
MDERITDALPHSGLRSLRKACLFDTGLPSAPPTHQFTILSILVRCRSDFRRELRTQRSVLPALVVAVRFSDEHAICA